ncbi:MAG: long-chain fatty acid--CoA ligase [Bacteroidetes bacterium]|nr:long-chain fatty acid--CoA ligase [Bacteroidota bacterium]
MSTQPVKRLFDLLDVYRENYPSKADALLKRKAGKWHAYSSADYINYSRTISLGLLSLGVQKGVKIATVLVNSPEWNFFDMGIMQVGAVQVPVYPTVSEDNYCYILNDSQSEYLIVSNNDIYQRVKHICPNIASLKGIFSIEKVKGLRHWKEILDMGLHYPEPSKLDRIKSEISPHDLATIIYTSGTTGKPKGVMLSHDNFISNYTACAAIPDFTSKDKALSFLPLCHVYERMLNYLFQSVGMSVYYCENIERVGDQIREVRPDTFAAVPRVLEKMYNRIVTRGRNLKGIRKTVFFWALRQGHNFELHHKRGIYYDVKLCIARVLVFRKWKKALGGRVKLIISGGAALHPRLARVFWAAGMPLIEGYGLTETSPVIAVSTFEKDGMKFGTVGPALPGVELKIAGDNEILCRGPNVMIGYYNRPERTSEVIDDEGWFHTGDLGVLEDGRYLRITDRKKEIFKTSTGKYIAPQVIEQKFRESPFIEHIMVIGENRKYTAALIVPDMEHLQGWCKVKEIRFVSPEKAVRNAKIIKRISEEVERINLELGKTEKIKKFRLLPAGWSVATGELSPTLKLRRKFILEKYEKIIEDTYKSQEYNYRVEEES